MSPYLVGQFDADLVRYRAAVDGADFATARRLRDMMINRIRADIRLNSGEFEDQLRHDMARWATGADVTELGLALATTVVGGEQTKTVLGAILTAVKGSRISIDKNYFREKSSEALIAMLRASRVEQDNQIVGKMSSLDVMGYPFEEAWNDLVDLYYAGTLTSALQRLSEKAGATADQAREDQAELTEQRVRSVEYNLNDRGLRDKIVNWMSAADPGPRSGQTAEEATGERVTLAMAWLRKPESEVPRDLQDDPNFFAERANEALLQAFISEVIEGGAGAPGG
ncbi:MAG: hypothetical protein IT431_06770 [Phycisphaerales bacterium]|nr:hypothetical protein [Phycisphaerales bacterium]